ncbi:MAG: GntR family transcriptional regulator [Atopobium sp.]|uniref:GntR family transcriptional regulator n=1 Tax=Atopobium sp. TaxID=1872650 RepID=UPI002A765A9F|nr:GntR family transcriptional regulator [Atopobium sp.]MDY2788860.1 GntR family transcriptional regulator [Atopobium sp.]
MPAPLYQQIYEEIQLAIQNGEYVEDQMLPTEKELIEKYGVSRITVRRAIEDLCANGYLIKRQGKGTFVAPPHMNRAFLQSNMVQSFTDLCISAGVRPGAHVISREIVPAREQEREFLGLPQGSLLLYIKRLRLADDMPIFEENLFLPYQGSEELFSANLEDVSIFATMKDLIGRYPNSTYRRTVEAVNANVRQASNLSIQPRSALLYLHVLFLDQNKKPLCIGKQYYVGSRYQFDV